MQFLLVFCHLFFCFFLFFSKKVLIIQFFFVYLQSENRNIINIFKLIVMKKFLSSLFVACFTATLFGQVLLTENFDGTTMPAGWTIDNYPSNWSISNSNTAGGTPRELRLYWNPQWVGKTRVISPVINTTGSTNLVIEFLQYL